MITSALSYIAGEWRRVGIARSLHNPANLDEEIGAVWLADPSTAVKAVDSAEAAWPAWRATPFDARSEILKRALALIQESEDEIARTLTRENGKTLKEAYSETAGALKDGRYLLQVAREDHRDGGRSSEIRFDPLGVFVQITPWNFPLSTLVRKMIPALALGNTVVVKPSEVTPLTPAAWFRCLQDAGLPAGVANLVQGEGPVVGPPLVRHVAVRGVSFTGSTRTGLLIEKEMQERSGRAQLEMGGKNALVVLRDADLDAAADAAVYAGFSCAGQWCTSTSRVIAEVPVYDALLEKIVQRTGEIRIGDGMNAATTMGPVASAMQHDKVRRAIERAKQDGAELACGGELPETIEGKRGYWVQPTVFAGVDPGSDLAREEVFGPVLAVMRARDADDALRLANATDYGLAFSIYTKNEALAERFMLEADAGMCHVNLPTSFREPAMPLTGWKASGRGAPECGRFAREFYTRAKAVYRSG